MLHVDNKPQGQNSKIFEETGEYMGTLCCGWVVVIKTLGCRARTEPHNEGEPPSVDLLVALTPHSDEA